jgi:hypothetical protein
MATVVNVSGVIEEGQTVQDLIRGPWAQEIQSAYLLEMETLTQGGDTGYRPNFPSVVQTVLWPLHSTANFNYIQSVTWLIMVYQQTGAEDEPLLHKPR